MIQPILVPGDAEEPSSASTSQDYDLRYRFNLLCILLCEQLTASPTNSGAFVMELRFFMWLSGWGIKAREMLG